MNQTFQEKTDVSARQQMAAELTRVRATFSKRRNRLHYSLFEPAQMLAIQERERLAVHMLSDYGISSLDTLKILELGCGTGVWLREFVRWGARPGNVTGIDLIPERILEAKQLCPPGVRLRCGSATQIESGDCTFDLVVQSTMFTSILSSQVKFQIAHEMLRVLRPDGLILWYDFRVNNPGNPDVRGIRKTEVRELFPNCRINFQTLTLAPPIARPLARVSTSLYRVLSCISLFRTHYLALISRGENSSDGQARRTFVDGQ